MPASMAASARNDDPAHVAENRRRMAAAIGVAPERFLTAYQVHSPDVAVADRRRGTTPRARAPTPSSPAPRASRSASPPPIAGRSCSPIPSARVIGAAHAGWKGALTGVLESTIDAMEKLGADRDGIVAAIGPLIRQASYEVGAEFVERFMAGRRRAMPRFFIPSPRDGHAMFDLAGFIRQRLERAGVDDDRRYRPRYLSGPERFFSYRRTVHRQEPDYGRHVHAIALGR